MIKKTAIIGTGSAFPDRVVTNFDLEKIVDTSDEWITKRTGIKTRRVSREGCNEDASDLAAGAAKNALDMAGIAPEQVDLIIIGTVTQDRHFPSCSCFVQEKIGAKNAAAFDLSAGCCGFVYGLSLADSLIKTGAHKTIVVIGVERISPMLDWTDRNNCVLFGDGAGAVVVTATDSPNHILSTQLRSDGTYWDLLHSEYGTPPMAPSLMPITPKPFYVVMEGNRVFKKAVGNMTAVTADVLAEAGIKTEDIDLVIPHQANLRIITALADRLGVGMDRVYTNVQTFGNTSSASIPIALDEANRNGILHAGNTILFVTFGAGLTWAAALLRWGDLSVG